MRLESWKGTERIVLGGGLIASRIGELSMGRASIMLKGGGVDVELCSIRNHPDEAGLIGSVQLAPPGSWPATTRSWRSTSAARTCAVGVVELRAGKRGDVAEADVWKREHWRHFDDKPTRDEAIERIGGMLAKLIERATKEKMKLAPFVGIGCPGLIDEPAPSSRAARTCPAIGRAKASTYRSAARAAPADRRPRIVIQMHNDAVVQGLERGAEHGGRAALGRDDDRHRAGQRRDSPIGTND